jgi:hypothetical protein
LQKKHPSISTFARLGEFISQFPNGVRSDSPELAELNETHFVDFTSIVETEHIYNPWFTKEFLLEALHGIAQMISEEVLLRWLEAYEDSRFPATKPKTVGLILAGNIPLVGFHDLLSVLMAGHKVLAKPSSKENRLIRMVAEVISAIDPELGSHIEFVDEKLTGMDAVIATGSNNSARYFEYYFKNIPHIIRKNRNGIAVLTGEETEEELAGIGKDIFTYFGLGCRNVTKLYIPDGYDLKVLLGVLDRYHVLYQNNKYANNVDYYRTMYLMNQDSLLDNEVLLLKEDSAIASPVGVVFYERYSEIGWIEQELNARKEEIQCVVSVHPRIKGALTPGSTQNPKPWDYADGVDTLRFLIELD